MMVAVGPSHCGIIADGKGWRQGDVAVEAGECIRPREDRGSAM